MKHKWLVLVLMLYPTLVVAQTTTQQIRRGTPMWFEHDDQSVLITEKYRICEDEINDTRCHEFTNVTKIGASTGMSTFQFPLPDAVTNGTHIYSLQAFGDGEWSDPSPTLTLKITGKPLPPQNLRSTNSGVASTSSTTTPVPAVMFPSSSTPSTTKPKP